MRAHRIVVLEGPRELAFSFEEMLSYHGGGSPGGVAHAFKVLERALALLGGLAERREIVIETAFAGPGARDGFELVTRAVSDDRFTVEESLARPELGVAREHFVFRLGYRKRVLELTLREGFVTDQFVALARQASRTAEEEQLLARLKADMATRVMGAAAEDVYDVCS